MDKDNPEESYISMFSNKYNYKKRLVPMFIIIISLKIRKLDPWDEKKNEHDMDF